MANEVYRHAADIDPDDPGTYIVCTAGTPTLIPVGYTEFVADTIAVQKDEIIGQSFIQWEVGIAILPVVQVTITTATDTASALQQRRAFFTVGDSGDTAASSGATLNSYIQPTGIAATEGQTLSLFVISDQTINVKEALLVGSRHT